jgi:hypothetical protein
VSIERRVLSSGEVVWRVRWREGNRNRSRALGRKADAVAFDAEVKRRARVGELVAIDAGRQRLDEFAGEWMRAYGKPNLSARTIKSYAATWDLHVSPRIGCGCERSRSRRASGLRPIWRRPALGPRRVGGC